MDAGSSFPTCAHPPQARCKRQIVALPGPEEFEIKMRGTVAAAIVRMSRIRIGDGTQDAEDHRDVLRRRVAGLSNFGNLWTQTMHWIFLKGGKAW